MSVFGNRSGLRTSVSVLLLICLFGANCAAMIYRPSVGRFKDGFVLWHKDQFYLFSMYNTTGDEANFRNVWLATSSDGVHWKDVGPVIKDAPFNIWAMSVHRVGDRFIMNHGSFTRPGVQNVIRFWESTDLVHWTFMGHEADLFPDPRWYHPDSRLDCMSVVPVVEDGQTKYYGFATGPGGFLESDGRHSLVGKAATARSTGAPFRLRPRRRTRADSRSVAATRSAASTIWSAAGSTTWAPPDTASTRSSPTRRQVPFAPTRPPIDCAATRRAGSPCGPASARPNSDLLVNGYMYSGYTYETGETWLPPLKRAVVDSGGHLRLGYWKGNDALKGAPVNVDLSTCRKVYPGEANRDCSCSAAANRLDLQAQPERNSILRTNVPTTVAVLDSTFDLQPRASSSKERFRRPAEIAGWWLRRSDSTWRRSPAKAPRSCCTATAGRRSAR